MNEEVFKICAICGKNIHPDEDYIQIGEEIYHERCKNGCPRCG